MRPGRLMINLLTVSSFRVLIERSRYEKGFLGNASTSVSGSARITLSFSKRA